MFARIAVLMLLIFSALEVQSAELKLINRFLASHPLASSDGQLPIDLTDVIKKWSKGDEEERVLLLHKYFFPAVQVSRHNKLVALISPDVVLSNKFKLDFREWPIWSQIIDYAKENNIDIVEYEARWYDADQYGLTIPVTSPSYLFINTSFEKKEQIKKYFIDNRRHSLFHPDNDIDFIVEGYVFGYFLEHIKSFYALPEEKRKEKFDDVHDKALKKLKKFYVKDVEELRSGVNKFSALNKE